MKKIIFLLAISLFFSSYCFGFDDQDFQYWDTEDIAWEVNNDLKISLEEEFRFGDEAHTLGIKKRSLSKKDSQGC